MRQLLIVLFMLALVGCGSNAKQSPTVTRTGDSELDKKLTEADMAVADMGKIAERIAWIDEQAQPLIDQLEKATKSLDTASDPNEKVKLRAQIKVISVKLKAKQGEYKKLFGTEFITEKPKAGAFRTDLKPKSHYGHVANIDSLVITKEPRFDNKPYYRSGISGINTEWHLPMKGVDPETYESCSSQMLLDGSVVHVRRAKGCTRLLSPADKLK